MNHLHVNTNVPANSSGEKTYLCDYSYEGTLWSVEIVASSFEDAEKRLQALSRGKVAGEVKVVIPLPTTWLTKVMTQVKNVMGQLV